MKRLLIMALSAMPVAALARFQVRDAGFDHERDRNGRDHVRRSHLALT